MQLEIGGKRYPVKRIEDLTLKHIAQFQFEMGSGQFDGITTLRTLNDVKQAMGAWGNLPKAEQDGYPDALFLTCFTVWAARALAGEDITLMDAIDVPASSLRWVAEPSDRPNPQPGKAHGSGGGVRRGKGKKRR